MRGRWFAVLAVVTGMLIGGFLPAESARRERLRDPRPIPLRCGIGPEEAHRLVLEFLASTGLPYDQAMSPAIRGALQVLGNANWVAVPLDGGVLEATLTIRDHVLVARIYFSEEEIRVKYHDSVNLNYAAYRGSRYLHPKANAWLAQLGAAIRKVVAMACLEGERAPGSAEVRQGGTRDYPQCTAEQVEGMRGLGLSEEQIHAACGERH